MLRRAWVREESQSFWRTALKRSCTVGFWRWYFCLLGNRYSQRQYSEVWSPGQALASLMRNSSSRAPLQTHWSSSPGAGAPCSASISLRDGDAGRGLRTSVAVPGDPSTVRHTAARTFLHQRVGAQTGMTGIGTDSATQNDLRQNPTCPRRLKSRSWIKTTWGTETKSSHRRGLVLQRYLIKITQQQSVDFEDGDNP